jgi:hypothetical protein
MMSEIEEEGWCHYSGMPSPNAYDKTKKMSEERKELIQKFEKWLATNPSPRIIASQCANIAEDYAEKKINEIKPKKK